MSLSLDTKIVAPFLEMLNTFSLVKRWCFSLKIRAFVRCSHGNKYVNHSAVFEIFLKELCHLIHLFIELLNLANLKKSNDRL